MSQINPFSKILIFLFLAICKLSFSQTWPNDTISPQINTGDPSFPFPQFLEYDYGKSLAANNAEGVTHADMEKAMREAYIIMMRRALKVPGKTLGGTQYLIFNHPSVPQGYGTFVSEGDGYALLAAAYFADKKTFDGLWLWIHDNRFSAVKKYFDCTDLRPTYTYGAGLAGWKSTDADPITSTDINSAADGDVDIALALVMAYKQWGDNMGIVDACGNQISYKEEALKMVKVMVDTLYYDTSPQGAQAGIKGYLSGIVGIDGYQKSGNTWGEVTTWRSSPANTAYPWAQAKPDPIQVTSKYVDYIAPAYWNEFAKFLEENGGTKWQIDQCKRAEASSDWTMGDMYKKGLISSAGNYTVSNDGSVTTYGPFAAGEDFRLSWRTHLNYVWHGNPDSTWNPVTHQIDPGGNTFEYDMSVRHKEFLKKPPVKNPNDPSDTECKKLGGSPDPGQPKWNGVAQIVQQYSAQGQILANYNVNWPVATGTPAAVASEDLDLLAEFYRQCELVWDDQSGSGKMANPNDRYLGSTPKYFHGWFRVLGMLTATGNLHAPKDMIPAANIKVYMDVDKTFAYEGDILNYEVSYRNYGVIDATNVQVTTDLDPKYEVVSISDGGSVSGNKITWNIGTVKGFKTGGLEVTKGKRTFVVRVRPIEDATIVCLTSIITSDNAPTWVSNEYPNNASYTMERNCVDLLKDRVLAIKKTTDREVMNPGDIVNFTLDFENKTGSNLWLNGGRDRVVISYANYLQNNGTASSNYYQYYRIWHTAHEAYINLGNYRVSYFLNDPVAIGEYNAATNPTGWTSSIDNQNDLTKYGYNPTTLPLNQQMRFTYQKIPWGVDAVGSWNQRIVTQFANVLTATTTHVYDKLDGEYLLHKGVVGPSIIRTKLDPNPASPLPQRLADDWSYDATIRTSDLGGQNDSYFPITPSYTDFNTTPKFSPKVVDNYSKDACGGPVKNFDKVLLEEFDGYTWRRIAGNGPLPGRETYNVEVVDSIPIELAWDSFTDDLAVGVKATYTPLVGNAKYSGVVRWSIPVMLTGEKGNLSYRTIAKNPPCPAPDKNFINAAWISSDVDSPDSSSVNLKVTCNPVPPTAPGESSLDKVADKTNVEVDENVTYTLTFVNKDGSTGTFNGTSTLASEWRVAGTGTTIPKLNEAIISLDQNGGNNSPGANGYAFEHTKVHGVNGWVETTIDPNNSSALSFFFRHSAGTPGLADFRGVRLEIVPNDGGNNFVTFNLFNNNTLLTTTKMSFGGKPDPINMKMELIDDKLYVFVDDYEGAPLKVFTGITQLTAGYTGIFAKGSQQAVAAWKGHFDSAFDLVISDVLPTELDIPSSISNSGIFAAGKITWPTVSGPILANATEVRTFTSKVKTCADFIVNIGRADVYGVSGILSQAVVNCGEVPPSCTPPTLITLTTTSATGCLGDSQILIAKATGGSYNYEFRDETGIIQSASRDSIIKVGKTGKYVVHVTDILSPLTCEGTSDTLVITIHPKLSFVQDSVVCSTGADEAVFSGTIHGGTKPYTVTPAGAVITNDSIVTYTFPTSGLTSYSVQVTDASGCVANDSTIVETINCDCPVEAFLSLVGSDSICEGDTSEINIKVKGTASLPATYTLDIFKDGAIYQTLTANATTDDSLSINLGNLEPGVYTIDQVSDGKCIGVATGEATIIGLDTIEITQNLVPSLVLCPSDTIDLEVLATGTVKLGQTALNYAWTKDLSPIGIDSNRYQKTQLTSADAGDYQVEITGACGFKTSITTNVVIQDSVKITTDLLTTAQDLCPSNTINLSIAATGTPKAGESDLIYTWTGGQSAGTVTDTYTKTSPLVAADSSKYQVSVEGACNTARSAITPISIAEEVQITTDPIGENLCPGDTLNLEVEAIGTAQTGKTALTYVWKKGTQILGKDSTGYQKIGVTAIDAGDYTVEVLGKCNSTPQVAANAPVISGIASVQVGTSTIITSQPDTMSTCVSSTANFSVAATGDNLTYQWYLKGIALSSETDPTLTITNAQAADSGAYVVEVIGTCGKDTSVVAALNLTDTETPKVTLKADKHEVCAGTSVTFRASGNGTGTAPMYSFYNTLTNDTLQASSPSNEYIASSVTDYIQVGVLMRSNSECKAPLAPNPVLATDSVQVVLPATASINSPTTADTLLIATDEVSNLAVTKPSNTARYTYQDTWKKLNTTNVPATAVQVTQTSATDADGIGTAEVVGMTQTDGITQVEVSVQDENKICPAALDTITFVRKDITSPVLKDTSLCVPQSAVTLRGNDPLPSIETAYMLGIDGVQTQTQEAIIPAGTAGGSYQASYKIYNSLADDTLKTTANITIYDLPTPADAGDSIITCAESEELKGNSLSGITTGKWTCDGGDLSNETSPTATLSNIAVGANIQCIWKTTSNVLCPTSSDTTYVVRAAEATAPDILVNGVKKNGQEQILCETETFTLEGKAPNTSNNETATWRTVSGTSVIGITGTNPDLGTLSPADTGKTVIQWIITSAVAGCAPDTGEVSFKVYGTPNAAISYISTLDTCADLDKLILETAAIETNDIGTWTTTPAPTQVSKTATTTTWELAGTALSLGLNTFVYEVENPGCGKDMDTKTLNVADVVIPTIMLLDLPRQCIGSSITAQALGISGGGLNPRYVWDYDGDTKPADTLTSSNFTLTNVQEPGGAISVQLLSSLKCARPQTVSTTTDLEVAAGPQPVLEVFGDSIICIDAPITISAIDLAPITEGTSYQWYKDGFILSDADTTLELKDVKESGVYTLKANNGLCAEVPTDTSLTVNVINLPYVNASLNGVNPIIAMEGEVMNLSGDYLGESAHWSSKESAIQSAIADINNMISTINTVGQGGQHLVYLTAEDGPCEAKDSVKIIVRIGIQAPNVFTHNGDGYNEYFQIRGIETYPGAWVRIFNRWGNLVYETNNYPAEPWDGGEVPDGVYFYIIDTQDKNIQNKTGVVHLVR